MEDTETLSVEMYRAQTQASGSPVPPGLPELGGSERLGDSPPLHPPPHSKFLTGPSLLYSQATLMLIMGQDVDRTS